MVVVVVSSSSSSSSSSSVVVVVVVGGMGNFDIFSHCLKACQSACIHITTHLDRMVPVMLG